jgi:hypothetical protein
MAAPSMNALAEELAPAGVGSIFLYTHEAHPGEYYSHLTSFEQKLRHARDLRDILGVARPILLDALDGACHRAYGSMPNMTWIITQAGFPIYKSNWTDVNSVANALDYFLQVRERRRGGERLAQFRVERLDYRRQDQAAFYEGLARNGPKAVREFRDVFR